MNPRPEFETKALSAFAAAVLMATALAAITWKVSQDALEATLSLAHTREVLDGLADAKVETLQIELSTQNHRVTGDARHLGERDRAISVRESIFRRIKVLTADSPGQQVRLARLRATADERLAISRRVVHLRETQGLEAASAYVASAPLRETRERMFQGFREMEDEEQRLLGERNATRIRAHDHATIAGALAVLALAWVLVSTYFLIRRQFTERRRAEATLRKSEERYRTLFDSIDEGFCIIGMIFDGQGKPVDYRFLEINPSFEKQTGLSNALGKRMLELAPLHEAHWFETYGRIAVTGEPARFQNRAEQLHRSYDVYAFRFGEPEDRQVAILFSDITQRNHAEEEVRRLNANLERLVVERTAELRLSEREFRSTFERAAVGVVHIDPSGNFLKVNPRFCEIGGYTEEELVGTPFSALTHPADLAAELEGVGRLLRKELATFALEHRLRLKSGGVAWVHLTASAVRDDNGNIAYLIGFIENITERRQAEQRIREQLANLSLLDQITRATGERQDLRSIFQVVIRSLEDSLPIDFGCVCLHDPAANALTVMCVGSKSEVLSRDLVSAEQISIGIDRNGLARCVQGQLVYEPDIGSSEFPFPQRLARGGLRSVVMAPLKSESRVFGVLVAARREAQGFSSVECEFLRQLSEHVALAAHQAQLYGALQQAYDDLRQTQQAVMQQERLSALGQMASGIAHDINNALSPVSLYTESMLETEPDLSERARGYLQTIQRAVEDVAQTVARMREFYRQREPELVLSPVQLNSMVQQVVDLTKARWNDMPQSRGIVIRERTELSPGLPRIMGVESEIREALTNLVFNAVDAMPEGGTLTLRTRLHGAPEQPAVAIEVIDSGLGMDEDTRRRCLEPFFTTKGERGTGLGLAMVFGMVQRHSAELEIDSAPGTGTTMRLVFGVATAPIAQPGRPAALAVPKRLRLLLVDDDPILLKSLRDALETDGHLIVTANGGEAGIAAFRMALARGETYAAVITDLGMPYVDGRRVAAAVKEASPATPVILLTGWGQRLVAEGDIPPHVDRVLAKPPKLRELRETLAQLCAAKLAAPAP